MKSKINKKNGTLTIEIKMDEIPEVYFAVNDYFEKADIENVRTSSSLLMAELVEHLHLDRLNNIKNKTNNSK